MTSQRHPPQIDVLYLSYDGLMEPLGQSQVLPYVYALAAQGVRLELLSFEKPKDVQDSSRLASLEEELGNHGVRWTRLAYHSRPKLLSTAFDFVVGSWTAYRRVLATDAQVVHARSYVPSLMAIIVKRLTGIQFVFDMRGFWPDERVELGIFGKDGFLYRLTKFFEKRFLLRANRTIVLTHKSRDILMESPHLKGRLDPIVVIPCCVDTSRFRPQTPSLQLTAQNDLTDNLVVGNIGAVNGMYLIPQTFRLAFHLKKRVPQLKFVYLTRQDPAPVYRCAIEQGLDREDVLVTQAYPSEIPEWLSLFQLGVFLLKPCYATQASCPTKLGEFLAAGVPVVTSAGVGDVEEILKDERAGTLVHDFSDKELASVAARVAEKLPVREELREACRRVAAEHFGLETGCARYLSVYRTLLSPSSPAVTNELPGETL